ncbi:TadE/TadG family type IV pilus assembly protein [Brachybacterium kimchii]|uniref:Pilus assembly protein n=1 Tax=Brachybacterium kimchii TaxID=2942909 RepID=A0ABY4NBA7_9MICO|nr:TadE family protein [Brachybacterium kimchii]UQN31828.1 pilus assembly protein [Brachybacterium kimchii]
MTLGWRKTLRSSMPASSQDAASAIQLRSSAPSWRRRLEQGKVTESAIIFPLTIGLLFVIIQAGIWGYARSLAAYSAREGATAEASYQSTQSSETVTRAALADSAHGVLRSYTVTSTHSADSVTVTVRGHALSLMSPLEMPFIEQTVTVPVEDYVP